METKEFIDLIEKESKLGKIKCLDQVSEKFPQYKLPYEEVIDLGETYSTALNDLIAQHYYLVDNNIIEVIGFIHHQEESSKSEVYCSVFNKLADILKEGDKVEFIDKNPGSTGLSHDSIYTFIKKCTMKDTALNWIPAVEYCCNGNTYIRAEDSFNLKFKPVLKNFKSY